MRKHLLHAIRGLQGIRWLHATLLLALVVPTLYSLGLNTALVNNGALYAKCLLIALPIVLTTIAERRLKSMVLYLGASALLLAGTTMIAWNLGVLGDMTQAGRVGYTIILAIETVLMIGVRLADRLHNSEEQRMDPTWQPKDNILDKPSLTCLWAFGIVYLIGIGFTSPTLASEAFYSAVVYLFFVYLYHFIKGTERYFSLNKRVSGLPRRRIYGIGGGMLALFLVCLMVVLVPAIALVPYRSYTDVREMLKNERTQDDWEIEYDTQVQEQADTDMTWLLGEEEAAEAPAWLSAVFDGLAVAALLAVAYLFLRALRTLFHTFRNAYDDNGDIIEELDDMTADAANLADISLDQESASIRRRYRRLIRKHTPTRPNAAHTPTQLEQAANLADAPDMRAFHAQYEQVRYAGQNRKI